MESKFGCIKSLEIQINQNLLRNDFLALEKNETAKKFHKVENKTIISEKVFTSETPQTIFVFDSKMNLEVSQSPQVKVIKKRVGIAPSISAVATGKNPQNNCDQRSGLHGRS